MSEQCYVVTGPSGEVYRVRADFDGEPSEQDLEDLGAYMDFVAEAARKRMAESASRQPVGRVWCEATGTEVDLASVPTHTRPPFACPGPHHAPKQPTEDAS